MNNYFGIFPPQPDSLEEVKTPLGSGITASLALPELTLSTNLVAGTGITLTPSVSTTAITISAPNTFIPSYASLFSTAPQLLNAGTETVLTYNDIFIGTPDILFITPSTFTVTRAGVYKFLYSIQVDKQPGGGTNADVEVYIKISGTAVPNSSSRTNVTNGIEQLLTCEYIVALTENQTIAVAAFTTSATVLFPYYPNGGPVPATPSIIANLYRIA